MAGDKVKKGFMSYVLVLLLTLIAAFFVIVVVMIFNPGLNIMGYKYFSHVKEYKIDEPIENSQTKINLANATDIVVDGNLINFEIYRDNLVENTTIEIVNYQTGFAKAEQSTDFSYNIDYSLKEDGRYLLNIQLENANGFLYFNNNCYVRILIPASQVVNSTNSLMVSTEGGSISLGAGPALETESQSYFQFSNVTLNTKSGNVVIGKYLTCNFGNLSVNCGNGNFTCPYDISLVEGGKFNISGENANVELKSILSESYEDFDIIYNVSSGNFKVTEFIIGKLYLSTISSNVEIKYLIGELSSNDLVNTMNGFNLAIDAIAGDISLPFANNSNITINDASLCNMYINSTNANVTINKLSGNSWIETKQGNINVGLYSSEIDGDITLINDSGTTIVNGDEKMNNKLEVKSETGNITLNYNPVSSFTVNFYKANGEAKIDNISAEGYESSLKNPLYINGGGTIMSLYTNGQIALKIK